MPLLSPQGLDFKQLSCFPQLYFQVTKLFGQLPPLQGCLEKAGGHRGTHLIRKQ